MKGLVEAIEKEGMKNRYGKDIGADQRRGSQGI